MMRKLCYISRFGDSGRIRPENLQSRPRASDMFVGRIERTFAVRALDGHPVGRVFHRAPNVRDENFNRAESFTPTFRETVRE